MTSQKTTSPVPAKIAYIFVALAFVLGAAVGFGAGTSISSDSTSSDTATSSPIERSTGGNDEYTRPELPLLEANAQGTDRTTNFVLLMMTVMDTNDHRTVCDQFISDPMSVVNLLEKESSGFQWNNTAAVISLEQQCGVG